jgi:hypothetical protein
MESRILEALAVAERSNAELRDLFQVGLHEYSRELDSALQRLRKAKKIRVAGRRWTLATAAKPCKRCGGTGREP